MTTRDGAEHARIRAAYAARPLSDPRYSWTDPAHRLALQEREHRALAILSRSHRPPLERLRVLDLGCGTGQWLGDLVRWGVRPEHLVGVDLLPGRLAEARRRIAPAVRLVAAAGSALPIPSGAFDLVVLSTVLSSVLDAGVRRAIAGEAVRVLAPGGSVLWYDLAVDNPRNRDVRAVTRAELGVLFPGCAVRVRRITLVPPLARAVAPWSTALHRLLAAIPPLRTHYLGTITPGGTRD